VWKNATVSQMIASSMAVYAFPGCRLVTPRATMPAEPAPMPAEPAPMPAEPAPMPVAPMAEAVDPVEPAPASAPMPEAVDPVDPVDPVVGEVACAAPFFFFC